MEFFEWMQMGRMFYALFGPLFGKSDSSAPIAEQVLSLQRQTQLELIVTMAIGAGLFLCFLLLGGFGLYKMAKKLGMKHRWLAFIPFANTYYAGKVAGEARFFGQRMKRAGLYAMLAEIAYVAINMLILFADIIMVKYYVARTVEPSYGNPYTEIGPTATSVPHAYRWLYYAAYANGGLGWASILNYVFYLAYLVFLGVTLVALFKKFNPRSYSIMTFVCILLPVRGLAYFCFRNRTPVDYNAYMRRRMEEYARRQNPYGTYGPYSGPQSPQGEEPFSDFGRQSNGGQNPPPPPSSDSPFSDF